MRWYNELAIRVSGSAWLFANTVFVFVGSLLFVFNNLAIPFRKIVGAPMFDLQNDLTVERIFIQLQYYNESAFAIYHAFMFVDLYFPFFAGLFLAACSAFALRHLSPKYYEAVKARHLFALFLIPTVCDWSENTFALTVVNAWPEAIEWAANGLILSKQAKLATTLFFNVVAGLLLVLALLKWVGTKVGLTNSR